MTDDRKILGGSSGCAAGECATDEERIAGIRTRDEARRYSLVQPYNAATKIPRSWDGVRLLARTAEEAAVMERAREDVPWLLEKLAALTEKLRLAEAVCELALQEDFSGPIRAALAAWRESRARKGKADAGELSETAPAKEKP